MDKYLLIGVLYWFILIGVNFRDKTERFRSFVCFSSLTCDPHVNFCFRYNWKILVSSMSCAHRTIRHMQFLHTVGWACAPYLPNRHSRRYNLRTVSHFCCHEKWKSEKHWTVLSSFGSHNIIDWSLASSIPTSHQGQLQELTDEKN